MSNDTTTLASSNHHLGAEQSRLPHPEMPTARVMGNRCPSRFARSAKGTSTGQHPAHPLLTGFPPPRGLGAGKGCCSPALAAENIADGLSGLPHRFRARACGEASAAASGGSSNTDRAWRGAWACAGSSGLALDVLDATSNAGRLCTHGVRSLGGAARARAALQEQPRHGAHSECSFRRRLLLLHRHSSHAPASRRRM